VLQQYLRYRPHDGFATAAAAIRRACTSRFYAQSGLFAGRAGMVLALAATAPPGPPDPAAVDQARRLAWHAVERDGLIGFPGDQLHRLSADLATGSAGVLLALGAALRDPVPNGTLPNGTLPNGTAPNETRPHLPFLEPPAQ
jgi:hypothetical protein